MSKHDLKDKRMKGLCNTSSKNKFFPTLPNSCHASPNYYLQMELQCEREFMYSNYLEGDRHKKSFS